MEDEKKFEGSKNEFTLDRREFLLSGVATGFTLRMKHQRLRPAMEALAASSVQTRAPEYVEIELKVNGENSRRKVDTRTTLLDFLREDLGLTGAKKGCDHGQCGACTVLADGRRINSCLSLAVQNDGKEITTIEGLAKGGDLHPIQLAFLEHDAFQCGFCTPGQILSAVALLNEPGTASEAGEQENMSGNICRCGAYRNILDAISQVRRGNTHGAV
jgi:xanthine dehydrogenase YagT iron-sulfur-binding subunit